MRFTSHADILIPPLRSTASPLLTTLLPPHSATTPATVGRGCLFGPMPAEH